ncbi:MAG: hypothetical protein SPE80_09860 [Faecalicoccus sp.]|nr:hypothetical protein [Faecalicoccus sp.]
MLSTAPMTAISKFSTADLMLVKPVRIVLLASLAVSAKPPVSVSHSIRALLKSSKLILPSFIASYSSKVLPLAIPNFLATLVNAGDIVSWRVRHDSKSGLPVASICEYC